MYVPDTPVLLFPVAFLLLGAAALAGRALARVRPAEPAWREALDVVRTATLTLLALIIGFTFSLAVGRYDLRKALEEAENNAIQTAYLRAGFLQDAPARSLRATMRAYLDLRIDAYAMRGDGASPAAADAAALEDRLWAVVEREASANPTPSTALLASAMTDVFDTAADSHAARINRIPPLAWYLNTSIAVLGCLLLGYGAPAGRGGRGLLAVLPLVVATSLLLIAELDTPSGGIIRVEPTNLQALSRRLDAAG